MAAVTSALTRSNTTPRDSLRALARVGLNRIAARREMPYPRARGTASQLAIILFFFFSILGTANGRHL